MSNIYVYIWVRRFHKFIDNPAAIWPFLKKKLYYNFIADSYLPYYKNLKCLGYKETLDYVIDNEKSLIRFGDDIFDIIQGIGIYFGNWRQKYHSLLAARSKEILTNPDSRILLCFNPELILKSKKEFKDENIKEQYNFWTYSKIFLKDYYDAETVYGRALTFHPRYNPDIDYLKLQKFFSRKHIIIVAPHIERFTGVSLGKTTSFVESPASDAWDKFEEIKKEVLKKAEKLSVENNGILIMVSMGSAGKVLVYDLARLNYVAWDTGQFFDLAFNEIKKIASPIHE